MINRSIFLKDFSLRGLSYHLNKADLFLIKQLISQIGHVDKKYLTIDFQVKYFRKGELTCKTASWHKDGKDNLYWMYQVGSPRTLFLTQDEYIWELPEHTLHQYTSEDLHKGRKITEDSFRMMIRFCYSDYMRPRRAIIYKNNWS